MPVTRRSLTLAQVADHVAERVFGGAADGATDACGRNGVGLELELLAGAGAGFDRLPPTSAESLISRLEPLPGGSSLTMEPGGQLELSTPCMPSLQGACDTAAEDLSWLERSCALEGIRLVALGNDPLRQPGRVVTAPRYRAMEEFFEAGGPSGLAMMTNTAAIQINIGLGRGEDLPRRWRLANSLGPTLIAAFTNSPFAHGEPTGWKSTRLRSWWSLDPSRSSPVPSTGNPIGNWIDYALNANVMLIRVMEQFHAQTKPMTFAEWLAKGHELGWPTLDDWSYHLTTLFPPVRPKGWFELRMLDALPTPLWRVAVAVVHALLTDAEAGAEAQQAVSASAGRWIEAARDGLGHPDLAESAKACFEIALASLEHSPGAGSVAEVVAAYFDRWVTRARSPADERLDAWIRTGELIPPVELAAPHTEFVIAGVSRH